MTRGRGKREGGGIHFAGAKGKDSLETCGISRGSLYHLVSRDAAGSIACQRRREAEAAAAVASAATVTAAAAAAAVAAVPPAYFEQQQQQPAKPAKPAKPASQPRSPLRESASFLPASFSFS